MWGIAWSFNPKDWRLGKSDALDDEGLVVGVWYFLGPVALTYDYDFYQ